MQRVIRGVLLAVFVLAAANSAHAQWLGGFWQRMKDGFHKSNDWPKPYVFKDREAVAAPMIMMVNNGWRRQNLLCEYHFEDDSMKLTSAGDLKVRWILTQAPAGRRVVFVQRGDRPAITAARVEAVQKLGLDILPNGELPDIVETNMETPGRPAQEVDTISVAWGGTMPVPRLPNRSGVAASGQNSSGGSNSSGAISR